LVEELLAQRRLQLDAADAADCRLLRELRLLLQHEPVGRV